jgi:phospholipid/cholesterol/gamma-HCH transport system substrate-binding protein
MQSTRSLEIGTGLFVLLGFAALAFLTTQLPGSSLRLKGADSGYKVIAAFDNIGDLKEGSPVTMAGVRVGRVEAIAFDPRTFKANVTLRIDKQYSQIPDDSDASIQTAGLLGGKYIGLGPGGSETFLKDGGQIEFTQSAIVLESLVNKFFANFASKGSDDKGSPEGTPEQKTDAPAKEQK